MILEKPRKSTSAKVQPITAKDKNVLQHKPRPMMLPSAMKSIRQNQTMFNCKGDKALVIDDVSEWITWQNKPVGFVFFGSILAIISLLTILLLWIFYYKLKMKFFRTLKRQNYYQGIKISKVFDQHFWQIQEFKKRYQTTKQTSKIQG